MKDLSFSGSIPYKIDGSLNLQAGFRGLTNKMLLVMFEMLKEEAPGDYPYSKYSTRDSNGSIETGIQLAIEADCFGTDFLMLRMHPNGYTLAMSSDDCDCIGSMEYEFPDDDELTDLIPSHVRDHLQKHRYGFDDDGEDDSIDELEL